MSVVERLAALGLAVPPGLAAVGSYAPTATLERALWVAGHTARSAQAPARAGVVGVDVPVEEAAAEAERAALNLLGTVEDAVGLDRVAGVLHLRGYVRSAADFTQHPAVLNGASEVLAAAFPDAPPPARAAVGVISLPGGACVELEAVLLLAD